jgi:NADPH-dependent 2,4-dienoyl-CoA reductase/sulfur reductase-like enzyme
LVADLDSGPDRVLIVGAGFTGSEVASACRGRGLAVTMVECLAAPLANVVGGLVGHWIGDVQRAAGVDLKSGLAVVELLGDSENRVIGARLSDGSMVKAELVVVSIGVVRNTEWLEGSDLDVGAAGCRCDAYCQALDASGRQVPDIFVCGEVARFPQPLSSGRAMALEHWSVAGEHAAVVAANIVQPESLRNDTSLPRFWSTQFRVSLKSSGLPSCADEVLIAQGSTEAGRFVALYARKGRLVGVVTVNQAKWISFYEEQILAGGGFPSEGRIVDRPEDARSRPFGSAGLRLEPLET